MEGHLYFITNVTYKRMPFLTEHIDLLFDALNSVKAKMSFYNIAYVVLPDHFHMIIDPLSNDISEIMKRIKLSFSKKYRYITKYHGRIWQYRFWDHIIRNQQDFNRHIDYIHYNPVKHGMINNPSKYKYSSMHEFINNGYYQSDWGLQEIDFVDHDFGE
ncbi:MAG: transposase [Candidatus Zixiibacteriota bacterium]